ncbi:Thiamine import ATP-binding protein ThiQ [Candidatus Hartigia pinicola]|nr:Thiamine import ATP-binding protein ThiQ [Candidatus Hartigia pinicola]
MIKLNQLNYQYDNMNMFFDFSMNSGERVSIMGPSGAGKSTLLDLISGFKFSTSGSLQLNGKNHTCTSPAHRPISMLFQDNNLFMHLTVQQNIGLGLHPGLRLHQDQIEQVKNIALQFGLLNFCNKLPNQLSGGQRQCVALARCLVRQQPILLLDEPFSGLDPALRSKILLLIDNICKLKDITLIMVSHNIKDALQISPRTLVISNGVIVYDGSTRELFLGKSSASKLIGIIKNII